MENINGATRNYNRRKKGNKKRETKVNIFQDKTRGVGVSKKEVHTDLMTTRCVSLRS